MLVRQLPAPPCCQHHVHPKHNLDQCSQGTFAALNPCGASQLLAVMAQDLREGRLRNPFLITQVRGLAHGARMDRCWGKRSKLRKSLNSRAWYSQGFRAAA